jgi:urease accessory protein
MSKIGARPVIAKAWQPSALAAVLHCWGLGQPALAHSGTAAAIGLEAGFLHPITGADHLVAMVAVGLWGAQLGNPAIWILPITFPLVMALGSVFGITGVVLPFPELIIGLSALALGTVVAFRARPPFWAAALLVGVFAIFHGYAHGVELPSAADPIGYGVGFITATGLLHVCGILIGTTMRWPHGDALVRVCGAAIGFAGVFFLWSLMGVTS